MENYPYSPYFPQKWSLWSKWSFFKLISKIFYNNAMEHDVNETILWIKRQIATSDKTTATGALGEIVIKEYLNEQARYSANQRKFAKLGDLWVLDKSTGEMLKIEVKTSKRGKRGKYQFCLRKADKHGRTTIDHADYVVLLCVGLSGAMTPFVVPAAALTSKKISIRNPQSDKSKYSQYRQRLDNLTFGA